MIADIHIHTIVNVVGNFYSDTAHALPLEAVEAGANQGLSTDGGGAHS